MEKIRLSELVQRAMERYQMDENMAKGTSGVPLAYRDKFMRYLKTTMGRNGKSLLENAIDPNYKSWNKKEKFFFSEKQAEEILSAGPIRDYCIEHSTSDEIRNAPTHKELAKKCDEEHARWIQSLKDNGLPYQPYIGVSISPDDIAEAQANIMLKALFELFYSPISEQFGKDMTTASLYGGDTETVESVESRARFADPKNYYAFNIDNPLMDKVLDRLADKIAERLQGTACQTKSQHP